MGRERERAVHHPVGVRASRRSGARCSMPAKPGWRRMLPVHTMRVGMSRSQQELLHRGAIDHRRRAGTGSASTWCRRPSVVRGRTTMSSWPRERVVEQREVALAPAVELGELVELDEPVRRHDLGRLEVVAHVVEHEDEVVGRAVGERAEAVVRLPCGSRRGTSPTGGPTVGASTSCRTSSSSSIATMPPLPAAVIACVRAKLVTTTSARSAGAGAAQLRVEHVAAVFDHEQPVARRRSRGCGPSRGSCPRGSGARIALVRGPIISSMRFDVDLVRVGLHVDEHGHDAATAPAARRRSRTSTAT